MKTWNNHDADRERYVRELLQRALGEGRWLVGAVQIAVYLNAQGWRTRHRNALVTACDVRRWVAGRRLPACRGVGGGSGRPLRTAEAILLAWMYGEQRCILPDRNKRPMERRQDRGSLAPEPSRAHRLHGRRHAASST